MTRDEYSYGGPARRKVSVVQKFVNGADVKKPIRQACTRVGSVKNISPMDHSMRKYDGRLRRAGLVAG